MFGKSRQMIKELIKLKKEGGMKLCGACALKKISEGTSDKGALDKLVKVGKLKKVGEGKCFICDDNAEYFISINDAMSGISATSRSKL